MTMNRLSIAALALASALVALTSYRFIFLGVAPAFPGMPEHISDRTLYFIAHIVASPIALAAGAIQFWPKLRARRPALHRWVGRLYGIAILVGGVSGLGLALSAKGGDIAGAGFALLSVVWVLTTARAVQLAMQKRVAQHRAWMIRSFALTFAAVTLRLQLPFFFIAGVDYAEASQWLAWSAWVPNLLVAEWMIRRRYKSQAAQ
ncbi:MAG: DUF2306 domain-containing protein [Neomegalonema sp.]|nr:DUF2306 domain-containing protein [Neomegalonema sp.]